MDKQILFIIPAAEEGEVTEGRDAAIPPGTTAAGLLQTAGKDPKNWQIPDWPSVS